MEKRFRKNFSAEALVWTLLLLLATLPAASAWRNDDDDDDDQPPRFSDWSIPVNLGAPVNNAGLIETDPLISKDGLSLYFVCTNCPGGYGDADIYVAQRPSLDAPWGPPQNLGPTINTPFADFGASLSINGRRLYFTSDRPGGAGGTDIYVSRRHNKRDDFAWRAPENLASVNTLDNEGWPAHFEDDATGVVYLYFASDRPGGLGDDDIYVATLQPDETFGPAALVEELSSFSRDRHVNIRRDGLELFLMSNRPGSIPNPRGMPSFDLWVATRASTSDPWSIPVNLGPVVNSPFHDGRPRLSFDGTTLYFFSARAGGLGPCSGASGGPPCFFDLWVTTRSKLKEPD